MTTGRINQVTILGRKENPSAKAPPLFAGDARFRTLITPPSFKQRAPVIRSGLAGLPVKGNPAFFATSFLVVTLAQFSCVPVGLARAEGKQEKCSLEGKFPSPGFVLSLTKGHRAQLQIKRRSPPLLWGQSLQAFFFFSEDNTTLSSDRPKIPPLIRLLAAKRKVNREQGLLVHPSSEPLPDTPAPTLLPANAFLCNRP